MKTTRQLLLVAAVSALLGACSRTQTPDAGAQKINCSGTVTDAAGHPVAGATVEYWSYTGSFLQPNELEIQKQATTAADGVFTLQKLRGTGFLVARKSGLAPAWKSLGQPFNPVSETGERLVLTPPATQAGVVVDESNRPVANAEVFVARVATEISRPDGGRSFNYLSGKPARDCFSTRTDATGHFRIGNFPTNATAVLLVRSPGKALHPPPQESVSYDSLPWQAGQEDIRLVVEPAGSIEGKIVIGETNQSLPLARVSLQPVGFGMVLGFSETEPVHSGADGAFHISDVPAGSYNLRAIFGTNAVPDWVAKSVPVSVESGQITRGVEVPATRGGVLEATVLGKNDGKPLAQISVNIFNQNFQANATSDSNGVALLRAPPGDYQVSAFRRSMSSEQVSATVAAGATNHVEIELAPPLKITGMVRQPNGQPAAGVLVRMVNAFGPFNADVKSDAAGKFDLEWNPRQFAGQAESTPCVLARDPEHDLAAAQDIDEDTTNVNLKLAPGLTLAGRAECNGKPITNAIATLVFWSGRSGMWLQGLARTNAPGQYEIPALPSGRRYGVIVSAPGYGQEQLFNLNISDNAGRQELDTVELKPANFKLVGQVLDADNKPVPGCFVNLNGNGQPNAHVRTDHDGRFTFDHVCEGPLQLFANSQNSYGSISAEGGDTNVVLQLGQTYSYSPGVTIHKLTGVMTDDAGQPAAGAQVAVFPNNGTSWTKTGPNGEYHLTWSLQPWQMQNGGALLVFRDKSRNLAGTEELSEDATNLNVKLKPAVAFSGQVKDSEGNPLAAAQITLWLKAGNSYGFMDQDTKIPVNAQGRFEIKCLPSDGQYLVAASAKGFGRHQQQLSPEYGTNLVELDTFVLRHADRVIAGRVLRDDDKPASGVNVQLNGEDQPDSRMTTDSQGRFHFQVCEGHISLFAYSQYGGGNAQTTVEAGDTNIVMTLISQPGNVRPSPRRASLTGSPLPDLATVNLASDAVPAGKPLLLCLFNAGERPSRHIVHLLDEQAAALRQKNICVLGVQAAVISDEIFNAWKTAAPVSFPVGRVTAKSEKTGWARNVTALPWLILTDANHRVIAEGFSLDDLDAQIQKLK